MDQIKEKLDQILAVTSNTDSQLAEYRKENDSKVSSLNSRADSMKQKSNHWKGASLFWKQLNLILTTRDWIMRS